MQFLQQAAAKWMKTNTYIVNKMIKASLKHAAWLQDRATSARRHQADQWEEAEGVPSGSISHRYVT